MEDRIVIQKDGHVAQVKLNRPDKLNAIDIDMFNAIIETSQSINADASIRAVVLSGEGRAFCAGLDVSNFSMDGQSELMSTSLTDRTFGDSNKWQMAAMAWRDIQVPVISAVKGIAFGGGLQIMMGTDIKYIHPETKLAILEGKWGLIPDMAGPVLMRNQIREDIFRELTYTQRVFSGKEAVAYGFATHLSEDPLKDATDLAHEIAKRSPSATVAAKSMINKINYLSQAEGLMLESVEQDKIMKKHNQVEAVFAGFQKREPKFKDYRNTEK